MKWTMSLLCLCLAGCQIPYTNPQPPGLEVEGHKGLSGGGFKIKWGMNANGSIKGVKWHRDDNVIELESAELGLDTSTVLKEQMAGAPQVFAAFTALQQVYGANTVSILNAIGAMFPETVPMIRAINEGQLASMGIGANLGQPYPDLLASMKRLEALEESQKLTQEQLGEVMQIVKAILEQQPAPPPPVVDSPVEPAPVEPPQ